MAHNELAINAIIAIVSAWEMWKAFGSSNDLFISTAFHIL